MKLTKAKLISSVREGLINLGYEWFTDSLTGSDGLFGKIVNRHFFLMLGLTISKHFEGIFTASFYLSKCTRWGSLWGDIPRDSYQRVAHFLTDAERKILLDQEYAQEGIRDGWWKASEEIGCKNFLATIKITEPRFLDQKDVFEKIELSLEIKELEDYAKAVMMLVDENHSSFDYDFRFIPKKTIDQIPLKWFETSEKVLAERGAILNSNTIKLLAADAWRQKQLLSKHSV
jgi:hypothetical protein